MRMLKLEKSQDNNFITVSGDIDIIKQNRRAYRYLKDNIEHTMNDSHILVSFEEEQIALTINRIKKIASYIGADTVYSEDVISSIQDYVNEEEKFIEFSKKARDIRNNNCDIADFEKFTESVGKNLKNRSLYKLQLLSAYHLAFSQNACNFSVPGAGKTSVVYGAFSYLSNLNTEDIKYINKLLIISPLSAFGPWEIEYEECFGEKASSTRLTGSMTVEAKKDYLYSMEPSTITLMSYASVPSLKEELLYFLSRNRTMVVLDEAHKIKNTSGGIISKSVLEIATNCSARVILTGTPAPNGYEDLFNLFKFIWPTKNVIPFQTYQLKDISKREDDSRVQTLLDSIEPYFIRIRKSDLGITPATENPPIIVKMGDSQRRIYDYLEKKYMNDLINSHDSKFKTDLVKARLIRLMQCATNPNLLKEPLSEFAAIEGFDPTVVSEDTKLISEIMNYSDVEIPAKFVKAGELIKDITNNNQKVIVWATYIKNILQFQNYLLSIDINSKVLYGAIPVSTGEISENEIEEETRESIIKEFHKTDSDFSVIIANPFAVAESISLHKVCHNAIYLERSFNAAHFLQSKDRIHRYGLIQGTETNYYYLICEDSIDEVINERLIMKETRLREIIERMPIPLFSNVEMETGDEDIKALIAEYVRRTKKM